MALEIDIAQQAALADLGSKVTFAGAFASGVSWLFSSQGGIFLGALIGVSGLAVNWYFSSKRDRREEAENLRRQEEHEKRMKAPGAES